MKALFKYTQQLDVLPDPGQVNESMTPGEIIDHLLATTQTNSIYDAAMVLIARTDPCVLIKCVEVEAERAKMVV